MRYAAFLSYSHADARWAQWLHRRLETYRVPSRLVGTLGPDGPIGPRLGTVFRDRDELPTSGDLGTTIRAALADSATMIVVCSPAAAKSPWVQREIEAFQALGRGDRIACFIVDGEPAATDLERGCFPSALTSGGSDGVVREPLAADARRDGDGRDRAFLRLVAGLLGVSYDVLARRETQRRQRRLLMVTTASLAGMGIALALAVTAYVARNDAQRRQAQAEDILGFMLGDLRQKLTTVGRLDLMRAVDDKATSYFATLKPRDLTDRALEEQARSLTGIGTVRLDEGKNEAALRAFSEAYDRTRALSERQPKNGQRLFDRAQAEFWIGAVYQARGRYDEAQTWLTRYRDSALTLAAMDPGNFDWQLEVAYGEENLAVLDQSRGRNKEAEREFRSELALYQAWAKTHPRDTKIRFGVANTASFLGSLALADGRLAEAQSRFEQQVAALARNRLEEPDDATWKEDWLDAQVLLAQSLAMQGKVDRARHSIDEASALAERLAKQDPSNRTWQMTLGYCHWWQARLQMATAPEAADREANIAERLFAAGHAANPTDKPSMRWLAKSQLLLAEAALQLGEPDTAATLSRQAQATIAPAWNLARTEDLREVIARAKWLGGLADQARGDDAAALRAWSGAERLLRDGLGDPPAFGRMELLVRVLQAQQRHRDAGMFQARLQQSGYVPLPAWSPSGPSLATAR